MKIKAIITGVTGMVGEGVLAECLIHPDVEEILVIGRRSCGISDPKLKEIVHPDFFDLAPVAEQLKGYNACFFCLGVSSVGLSEQEYYRFTYTLTMNFAKVLAEQNPDMTFCYISGAGTDSTEKGRMSWARVKGKTENDLMKLPFGRVFACRPAFMLAAKGAKNTPRYYKYFSFLYPVVRALFPNYATTLREVAIAMINAALYGYRSQVLEVPDLLKLAALK